MLSQIKKAEENHYFGIITTIALHDDELLNYLRKKRELPIVFIGDYYQGVDFDTVKGDNYCSASSAVKYLTEKGHRRIAFYGADRAESRTQEQLHGFIDSMSSRGMIVSRGDLFFEGNDEKDGFSTAEKVASQGITHSAMIISNSCAAAGVKKYFEKIKKELPRYMSIICLEESKLCSEYCMDFTTFGCRYSDIGSVAVEQLIKRVYTPLAKHERIVLPIEENIRNSVFDCNTENIDPLESVLWIN